MPLAQVSPPSRARQPSGFHGGLVRVAHDGEYRLESEIHRSHRKLAHRGSRLEKVFVSESSVLRVLQAEILPA